MSGAYNKIIKMLTRGGVKPYFQVLDNEISLAMKNGKLGNKISTHTTRNSLRK